MKGHVARVMNLDLPAAQSAFLWGARKTGKSTLLRTLFPGSPVFDFLRTDLFLEMSSAPHRLREQLEAMNRDFSACPIILDEVQKVPGVLDEVHWMIENSGWQFILCGSSARKLKRGGGNLLGGRAWRFELFPFVYPELPDFDLLRALNHGLLPQHYLQPDATRSLKAYVRDYLKEEVFDEGLTRNIGAFSRFFDAVGFTNGQMVNYSNIARDCGVDAKTVREYFIILEDTLLGAHLPPWRPRPDRSLISRTPKFYLFDVGVAGALMKRRIPETRGAPFGQAFEHFILMELRAYSSYKELDFRISYWRTKSGKEVDFILGDGEVAIEVKGGRVDGPDLHTMRSFSKKYGPAKAIIVSNEREPRRHGSLDILPWHHFLTALWAGDIIA